MPAIAGAPFSEAAYLAASLLFYPLAKYSSMSITLPSHPDRFTRTLEDAQSGNGQRNRRLVRRRTANW
ncbi:hypothetical protein R69608_07283 [Paraburkholderia nemoris]|uniref:Uncharacterized protein n=1 Tax=Paraburkholderia nemoris TaxID=2793076 RepID=A0ABM8T2W5_9BURK|nr:hypothetical protein R69619_05702 [Paraburkholderia nemoris]CAE6874220.1 hypothetical protein R69749_06499 [Paraburkholderia domus]CAE6850213.1 hypothetical protein LMG22931_07660 [Paraburkholderia nemoris]CAE6853628.1 hypothetical protein R69776_07624 [Paraburkholderia nemoris]CAE6855224.1 hypothetical protein R75777_07748 [Paraburkholderia nemoris]